MHFLEEQIYVSDMDSSVFQHFVVRFCGLVLAARFYVAEIVWFKFKQFILCYLFQAQMTR